MVDPLLIVFWCEQRQIRERSHQLANFDCRLCVVIAHIPQHEGEKTRKRQKTDTLTFTFTFYQERIIGQKKVEEVKMG